MRRSYWSVIAAAIALLVAADALYWWLASNRLRNGVLAWEAAQRAAGWTISDPAVTIGGWPLVARVYVAGVDIRNAGPRLPGQATYRGDGLVLAVPLFRPTEIRVALNGPQRIGIGTNQAIVLTGADMTLAVPLRAGSASVRFLGRDLRLDPVDQAWHAAIGTLDADVQLMDSSDPAAPAATFSVAADAIALPTVRKWPLGGDIAALSLSGRLNGPLPPAGTGAGRSVTAWADAWRDGGGSLEIRHLALTWGPLDLVSSATLALDDQLQPMGSGSAKLVGYAETLDRLAAAGVLTKSAATVAKAVLSLLAGTGETGAPPSVEVPLTLQYRTLSMRQVPLARLPELDWPPR